MEHRICPITGKVLHRGERPLTLTYKGKSLTMIMPGWYSDESPEGVHESDDLKVSDRGLNRLKAEVENLLLPEEIRRIRKKLKLSQAAAGILIGGGPRAFQKYEAGDLLPSRAISNLLLILDEVPDAVKMLPDEKLQTH